MRFPVENCSSKVIVSESEIRTSPHGWTDRLLDGVSLLLINRLRYKAELQRE